MSWSLDHRRPEGNWICTYLVEVPTERLPLCSQLLSRKQMRPKRAQNREHVMTFTAGLLTSSHLHVSQECVDFTPNLVLKSVVSFFFGKEIKRKMSILPASTSQHELFPQTLSNISLYSQWSPSPSFQSGSWQKLAVHLRSNLRRIE